MAALERVLGGFIAPWWERLTPCGAPWWLGKPPKVEPLLCLRNDQNGNIVERLLSTLALVFRLLVPSSQPLSRLWREV